MAGKVCGDYYEADLNAALKGTAWSSLVVRLFTNNYTPIVLNELNSHFTECTDGSYAAWSLSGSDWTITNTSGVLSALTGTHTFTFAGAVSIYGYYVENVGKTKVYWAEVATGGPFVYGSSGGTLLLTLEVDGPAS